MNKKKSKLIPDPTPVGEISENVKNNDFVSWFSRLIKAFKGECSE